MHNVVDFVRLGYGDTQQPPLTVRALEFLTDELTSWADVKACLSVIGEYNLFDPALVAQAIEPLFGRVMHVRVGRAGSPLVVIDIAYWTSQQVGSFDPCGGGRRIEEDDRRAICADLVDALEPTGAICQIVDWRVSRGKTTQVACVRAWWD